MLSKIKELSDAATKFQNTINSLQNDLAKAKSGGGVAEELKTKLHAQEITIAQLKMQVQCSSHIHNAFLGGLAMRNSYSGSFASPASTASTATPPAAGHQTQIPGVAGFFPCGLD